MLELVVLFVAVFVFVWFYYIDRRNTQTATKTAIGVFFKTLLGFGKVIKAEANIMKIENDIANLETDRLNRFANRNAEKITAEFMEDLGLGKKFRANQKARLEAAKERFDRVKAKK